MATRFYLGRGDATAKTPNWTTRNIAYVAANSTFYETRTTTQVPTADTTGGAVTIDEDASGTTGLRYGILQFVTKPLAAQTILDAAIFKLRVCCKEANAAANMTLTIEVIQYNSSDVYVQELYYGNGGTEFDAADYDNRVATCSPVGDKAISAGDYLAFRISYIAANTKTTIYAGGVWLQYDAADPDVSDANETDAYPNTNPWIECSQTLVFQTPTVVLNTAEAYAFGADTTPTLEFTGTSGQAAPIRYNIQIDTVATFDSKGAAPALIDSYAGSLDAGTSLYNGANTKSGQTFTANGKSIGSAEFPLFKTGNPTGYATAQLFATSSGVPTGEALATSAPFNVGTLTATSYEAAEVISFVFWGVEQYLTANGTVYWIGIVYEGGSVSNSISQAVDNTDPTHAGTGYYWSTSWNSSVADRNFALYDNESGPLLNKLSGTDAGFAGDPDNTDPFASAQLVSYTVQAGSELTTGTYYWRARGMDPAPGSGEYGAFAAAKSFTVETSADKNLSSIDKTTIRDIQTVQFDVFNIAGLDKATVRDIVSIFLDIMFLSKTDTVTVKDIVGIILDAMLAAGTDKTTIRDINTVFLETALADLTVAGGVDSATIQDVLTVILDIFCPSGADSATIKDILTVMFDSLIAAKVDTTTIKDILAIILDKLNVSKVDTTTTRDTLTLILDVLNAAGIDTITIRDISTVTLESVLADLDLSRIDSTTVRDIISIILDAFVPAFVDKTTIREIVTLILDKLNVTGADTTTIKDTLSVMVDALIRHSTETLTVRDILTVMFDALIISSVDKTTIKDSFIIQPDVFNAMGLDSATIREEYSIMIDKWFAQILDHTTLSDNVYIQSVQMLSEGRDYSEIADLAYITLVGFRPHWTRRSNILLEELR